MYIKILVYVGDHILSKDLVFKTLLVFSLKAKAFEEQLAAHPNARCLWKNRLPSQER